MSKILQDYKTELRYAIIEGHLQGFNYSERRVCAARRHVVFKLTDRYAALITRHMNRIARVMQNAEKEILG